MVEFRSALARFIQRRQPLLLALGVLLFALFIVRSQSGADAGSDSASLIQALGAQDLTVASENILWLEPHPGLLSSRSALVLAAGPGEPNDVYHVALRGTEAGAILEIHALSNLTRSSSADERQLVKAGDYAVYASVVRGRYDALTALDLRGEPPELTASWSGRTRLQNSISNLQESGRTIGFGRVRYGFMEPSESFELQASGALLDVALDSGTLQIDLGVADLAQSVRAGDDLIEMNQVEKGEPGAITWVVDTVRNSSFVGPEPIEWLEHRVFSLKDTLERGWHAVVGIDAAETELAVSEELGMSAAERRRRIELATTDEATGFPPPGIGTVLTPPLEGEGEWIAVVDDPFARTYPNSPTAFYQTYLRPDRERRYARVYITVWDPRQVQLNIVAGTREPESATGETGRGMAPRDAHTLSHLVGGFNGGFQALHGEFGMMSEGRVYLPPKPWAATIAVYQDGRVAMGSWTDPPEGTDSYAERWAVAQIPEDMVSFRQNLTSVVEGETFNPWGRWWWGAAPLNADQQVHIDRSGLCLTEDGFLGYFWGRSLGSEALGDAMLRMRCVRGMHLDMNSRHTGFEFYDIRAEGEHPPLDRPLTDAEFEGPVSRAEGFVVRSRKMASSMTPMRFPRYVGRDPRDFFYLTYRPRLPGPDLAVGSFETAGLPAAGYPPAFGRLRVGEDTAGSWIVRMDVDRVVVGSPALGGASEQVLAYVSDRAALGSGEVALYSEAGPIGRRYGVGVPPEGADVVLRGASVDGSSQASAAIGVDEEGFVVYIERVGEDPMSLGARLAQAQVAHAVALGPTSRLAFQSPSGLFGPDAYERPIDVEGAVPLFARDAQYHEVLFPDTEPRRYSEWARMQDSRVRYFREGSGTFSRGSGGVRDEPAN